jgi:choline-sulfatase
MAKNLLIIMADQLTAKAVGCYGHPVVKTPHIDALGETGVIFENAYCNSPLCTPGRYAFMTGQLISRFGGWDNASYLSSMVPTFAHYLRLMGYHTQLSGKMHFVGADQLHGFEDRHTTDIYPADFGWVPDWTRPDERIDLWYHNMSSVFQAGPAATTNQLSYDDEVGWAAERAIYHHVASRDDRPLALVASFIHPHDPYAARPEFWNLYDDAEIDMPRVPRPDAADNDPHSLRLEKVIDIDRVPVTDDDVRRARRAYYANVSYVDHWVGRLMNALEQTGLRDETTVILTADHGDMLGERGLWYKMSFREWSSRIPMIVNDPTLFRPHRVAAPVSQVDITPTLMDMAALDGVRDPVDPIDPLDGHSLLHLCEGGDGADRRVVGEYTAEGTVEPMLMLREGTLKFITCPGDPDQLFDLAADPDERINLADNPDHAETVAAFRAEAKAHWNADAVRDAVIADQHRRRVLSSALRIGRYHGWDWQPPRDAVNEYTRSHMDLTDHDYASRWPRPKPFPHEA